jgi:predicted nucleic acid-binding protein
MGRYTVDAVAMSRYLVDGLPSTADEIFARAEGGVDVLEAPTLTVAEAVWTATQKESIAGVTVGTTPNAVFRGLVTDGPLTVAPTDQQDLAVFGSLLDQHTLHDALLIANHRVRGTDAVVTNDAAFEGESTVWR